ncbi:MAG: MlaD family protein [Holosporales bacterium]|jgi:phospholipid/cholesterol/gamma-HCH transport system substrate-binding protein|nr:MlaD family protein [Holosporales bacterium]
MNGSVLEAVIGAVVLLVAAFFMYFAYISRGDNMMEGYILVAEFSDATGIAAGSDVKMCGIKIGTVKKLTISEHYQARVELLIKSEVSIPDDSSAAISSDGIMGNKFVSVISGFSQTSLQPGAEFSITRAAVSLEQLVDKFVAGGDQKSNGS